jgi:hypothetical protein
LNLTVACPLLFLPLLTALFSVHMGRHPATVKAKFQLRAGACLPLRGIKGVTRPMEELLGSAWNLGVDREPQ